MTSGGQAPDEGLVGGRTASAQSSADGSSAGGADPGPDGGRRFSLVDGPGWQLWAYGLWLVGSALFAVVALNNGDGLSFAASVLFFLGVAAVMIPLGRELRERK